MQSASALVALSKRSVHSKYTDSFIDPAKEDPSDDTCCDGRDPSIVVKTQLARLLSTGVTLLCWILAYHGAVRVWHSTLLQQSTTYLQRRFTQGRVCHVGSTGGMIESFECQLIHGVNWWLNHLLLDMGNYLHNLTMQNNQCAYITLFIGMWFTVQKSCKYVCSLLRAACGSLAKMHAALQKCIYAQCLGTINALHIIIALLYHHGPCSAERR